MATWVVAVRVRRWPLWVASVPAWIGLWVSSKLLGLVIPFTIRMTTTQGPEWSSISQFRSGGGNGRAA